MAKGMELLAPAGGMAELIAAVQSGADAVYLGAGMFSARAGAGNFSEEQLKNAVHKQFMNPESFELCFFTDSGDKLLNYLEYSLNEPSNAKVYKNL